MIIFRANSITLLKLQFLRRIFNSEEFKVSARTTLRALILATKITDFFCLQNNVTIPRHQTVEQRCIAAQLMLDSVEFNCPVMVDSMEDEAKRAYAGFPIRLYIIKNQQIQYAGGTGPTFYKPKEVKQWLQSIRTPAKNNRHRA